MRVEIITQVALKHAAPNREPVAIRVDHVDEVIAKAEYLEIGYTVAEKEGRQQLKLRICELYKATIEFF